LGNILKGYKTTAEYMKAAGNAQRLLESLWTILKGYWNLLGNSKLY
jgi:hypothetical protein